MTDKMLHFSLNMPEFDFDTNTLIQRICAHALDMQEDAVVQACVRTAEEAGITDLYLIDKQFVIDALMEKIKREEAKEDTER